MAEEIMMMHNVMSVELALKRELEYRRKMEVLGLQRQCDSKKALMPSQGPPSHLAGIKRKAPGSNLQCFPPPQVRPSCSHQPLRNRPICLVCKVCQVAFSSAFCLKQHCEGQKHKAQLLQMKINKKNGGFDVSNPLWCEPCQVSCSSGYTLEQHLTGKKHAACLQLIEDAKRGREKDSEAANFEWEELEWEMLS